MIYRFTIISDEAEGFMREIKIDADAKFLELLKKVKREGIEDLISFLEKSDFFKAPASTRFHGDHEGGLVEHSIKVYEILKDNIENIENLKSF